MNAHTILVLAQNEVRLRMRRLSTLVAMLAMISAVQQSGEGLTMVSRLSRILPIIQPLVIGGFYPARVSTIHFSLFTFHSFTTPILLNFSIR